MDGLVTGEDIDGDGRILQMRIEDPNGAWKAHPDEPRLMVRRDPIETGGKYYRILPEGLLKNYDGVTIKVLGPKQGLDLNRNFPAGWRPESDQHGAGPVPGLRAGGAQPGGFHCQAPEYYRHDLVPHDERCAAAPV